MLQKDIRVLGKYVAKVNGNVTTVRVDSIAKTARYTSRSREATIYHVTNLTTGKKVVFRSAARFLSVAGHEPPHRLVNARRQLSTVEKQIGAEFAEQVPVNIDVLAKVVANKTVTVPEIDPFEVEQGLRPAVVTGEGETIVVETDPANVEVEDRPDPRPTPAGSGASSSGTTGTPTDTFGGKRLEGPDNCFCGGCGQPSFACTCEQKSTPSPAASTPVVPELVAVPAPSTNGNMFSSLAQQVLRSGALVENDAPHLIVEARAGSGKTFSLVVGVVWMFRNKIIGLWDQLVQRLGFEPVPSPQQLAIWHAMESSSDARTIQFCTFNRSIVKDFEHKWSWVIDALKTHGVAFGFSTMHSMGFKSVNRAFSLRQPGAVEQYRVQNIIEEIVGVNIRQLRKDKPMLVAAVEELVGLCKVNLLEADTASLDYLVVGDEVDMDGVSRRECYEIVDKSLTRCADVSKDRCVDYDDMIYLPVHLNLPVFQHDLLLCDEVQDLSKCQRELAKRACKRLVACGDPRQALYSFAGAAADSMPALYKELGETSRGCDHLPLTVTRRCGKSIVREAQKTVAEFHAHESNPEGSVESARYTNVTKDGQPIIENGKQVETYRSIARDGDMVICRCNAPLVNQCFKFLKEGRKAVIQGRDIGKGLISTIKKMRADTIPHLVERLSDWYAAETAKERANRNPNENKLINLTDRYECLMCFTDGAKTVDDVTKKIESIFTDNKDAPGIKLSSIHRAKGAENSTVFFLMPKGAECPHPMAKSEWQREGEKCCLYVGVTRAINRLVFVS